MKPILCLCLLSLALGDIFLHNPRGSNDRLNEANENRNNGNRLFDSQNNAKGGYCYGPSMSYYEGSYLPIEYTVTRGCGNPNLKCNLVLQYMCGPSDATLDVLVRDGSTTDTVPNDANGPTAVDANGNPMYGMHENQGYYNACKSRRKNNGLWWPNQPPFPFMPALDTRQNNNGTRRGFECPEERDYYPYWHPAPWKDIAVITDNTQFCAQYQSESQNVKPRNYCQTADLIVPNNAVECNATGGRWVSQPAWGIAPPVCLQSQRIEEQSPAAVGGMMGRFDWVLPSSAQEPCANVDNCNCVLRIRHNITGGDLAGGPFGEFVDSRYNGANSPVQEDLINDFGYPNPIALATDPMVYSRVFQDRSYVFHLKKKPATVTTRIYNLNVKGKRGNIVQAYPAVQYDYSPETLNVAVGDYIHFQWTGCDTNPAGNAGEGTAQTDRTNIAQIASLDSNVPATTAWLSANRALFPDVTTRLKFSMLGQTNCLTYQQLLTKNTNNENNLEADVQNCMKLNAAPSYFDGGLVRMNSTGQYYFMSTRANSFTNRSHKGAIVVS